MLEPPSDTGADQLTVINPGEIRVADVACGGPGTVNPTGVTGFVRALAGELPDTLVAKTVNV